MVAGGKEKDVFNRQTAKRREERGLYFYSKPRLSLGREINNYQETQNITLLVLHSKVSMYPNCSFDFFLLLL